MANVSVIIPTYQSEKYIIQAIESVLAQTYKDFEIIIVDDGSTDNTPEILRIYSNFENIHIVRQSNQGPAAARNRGIELSSGEYVGFLDADDLWFPNKLERQIAYLEKHAEIDLVFCDAYIFDENRIMQKTLFDLSTPSSGRVLEKLFTMNFIPLLTVVVRRSIFNSIGYFDETLFGPEDYDLWLRISQLKKIDFIQETLAKYRVSAGQISKQRIRMLESEIRVKEKILNNAPELFRLPISFLDLGYYNLLIRIAKLYLQNNQKQESKKYIKKYKSQRGITMRYLAIQILISIPNAIQRKILVAWDRIRTKQVIEKNGT